jgi:hypothetical protein
MQFYILTGGQRKGPFTLEQLADQGLERDTPVWYRGQRDWARADQIPALGELMLTIPPPVPRPPEPAASDPLPPPPPGSPEEQAFLASWVRYRPGIFKTLYAWFLVTVGLIGLFAVAAVVFFILAENQRAAAYRLHFGGFMPPEQRRAQEMAQAAAWHRVNNLTLLGVLSILLASQALVVSFVLFCVLLYKAWNQIQDGRARTSAGKAAGFLFIPFFNFYWVFVAVYGLAWDLHNYVIRRRLYGRYDLTPFPVSPGLSLACCILMITAAVPFLNALTTLPMLVVAAIWLNGVKNASLGIAAARLEEPRWAPAPARPGALAPVAIPVSEPDPLAGPPPVPADRSEHVRRLDGEGPALEGRGARGEG